MDYDISFRADEQADKDPEDALEPVTNIGKAHQLIVNFFDKYILLNIVDNEEMTDRLIDLLKPYIKEN